MIKLKYMINKMLFQFAPNNMRILIGRQLGMKIGEGCRIYNCGIGSEPYLISIGNNTEITRGVNFITHDGATWIFRKNKKFEGTKYGPIIIKDNCMIGLNSIILPNVEIGPDSIIGAGSVVTKNVPPSSVYAGNPARYVCGIDEYLDKCNYKDTGKIPSKNKKELLLEKYKDKIE